MRTMNMNPTYKFISDPGHAWLEVPIKDVLLSGVYDHISAYSPIRHLTMYLEEDRDAYLFLNAMKRHGATVTIKEMYVEDFDKFLQEVEEVEEV